MRADAPRTPIKRIFRIIAFLVIAGSGVVSAAPPTLTARAAVGANTIFIGEPIQFQIQVSGSESPERPNLSAIKGFSIKFTGGGSNSRSSTRIANGQVTKNVQLGYLFNYELRATREGRLVIPAISVKADGQTTLTQPLAIMAQQPSETENFKLRLTVSKDHAFVGEQLVLEATFYFRANVSKPRLTIPLVDEDAFEVYDLESTDPQKLEVLDGKQFNTMRVRKILVPRRAGRFPGVPATLSFQGQKGSQTTKDFFGRRVQRPKFQNFVIPSNPLTLTIEQLPRQGRPASFSGHVGEYSLSVQATPTEVNVGDPITLNISVTGPPLLDPVDLPPLAGQESLTRDFKIPSEMESGAVHGNYKVFTQTVRALRDDVDAIPPIELAYFDTDTRRYEIARSQAVPIVVNPTRILTAGDVEGASPVGTEQLAIQSWTQGIAHNYTGTDLLATQALGFAGLASPARIALMATPPLVYVILLTAVGTIRRRNANPATMRARRALGHCVRQLAGTSTAEEVLSVFRSFLGDKLAMTSEALTFRDVRGPLERAKVGNNDLAAIERLFTAGEASRFAGDANPDTNTELRSQAERLARQLDKDLR